MTHFKLANHSLTGSQIVEIWENGKMIAVIYPLHGAIKVISKFSLVAIDSRLIMPQAIEINIGAA